MLLFRNFFLLFAVVAVLSIVLACIKNELLLLLYEFSHVNSFFSLFSFFCAIKFSLYYFFFQEQFVKLFFSSSPYFILFRGLFFFLSFSFFHASFHSPNRCLCFYKKIDFLFFIFILSLMPSNKSLISL